MLFSLYVNDMPTPSRHVELAQYADDTALAATPRSSSLLVGYLEAYLGRLEQWLRDWRITVNVSKSTAVLFDKAARRIQKPRPVDFLGQLIQWAETARHLGVTLDTQLTWPEHVNQVGKKAAQRLCVLGPLLNRRIGLSVRNGVLLYRQLIRPVMDYPCPIWRSAVRTHVQCCSPSVFALRITHLDTLVTGKLTSIWGFHCTPTTSDHLLRVSTQT
jgi:hypothetical protein